MKRIFKVAMLAALLPLAGLAQDANQMWPVILVSPQDLIQSQAATGMAVDVANYQGNSAFIATVEKSQTVGRTNLFTVQHSTTGTSGWKTLTNTVGTACVITITGTNTTAGYTSSVACDLAKAHKYIRGIACQAGTPNTNGVGLILLAPVKKN